MLRVIAVLDGRPGHEKQTRGIISNLKQSIDVEVTEIDTSKHKLIDRYKNYCLLLVPQRLQIQQKDIQADIAIGTGSRTHAILLLLRRRYNIPVYTCMTPPFVIRSCFTCCFVPEHDSTPRRSNIFYTLGAPNCSVDKQQHDPEQGLVLLGGIDTASHIWNDEQIADMVRMVIEKSANIHWTISSSPRTPDKTIVKIGQITKRHDNVEFFHYKDTPAGWIERQYEKCKTVWVTSDSISMLYEALSAGCNVNIFPMQWKRNSSKFKKNEDILLNKRRVRSYQEWLEGGYGTTYNEHLNEAQRCADQILRTCRPKSLP